MHRITTVVSIVLISLCIASQAHCADSGGSTPSDDNAQLERDRAADVNTTKMRAGEQRNLNDLMLLFGDKLPASKNCYQAAISNYIEDKWNAFAMSNGCASREVLCSKDPKGMEILAASLQHTGHDVNGARAAGIPVSRCWL
jgi:hypothetical protein